MGKTYTDFSQLSKGMFKKSDPVVEIKPIPRKSAGGDDALAYIHFCLVYGRYRKDIQA